MSILGKIFTKGKKGLTDFGLEEIRVEEKRLEIRENQHLRQIEKYDKLREEVFHQGAKNKSPARRRIYARRKDVMISIFWLSATWTLGILEVWIALWLLGYPSSFLVAFLIESLVQGVRAAAFLIPGALGAQEGGFLLVGTLLSIPAEGALALALARRARELAFGIPGLLAWQWFEARGHWRREHQDPAPSAEPALARENRSD